MLSSRLKSFRRISTTRSIAHVSKRFISKSASGELLKNDEVFTMGSGWTGALGTDSFKTNQVSSLKIPDEMQEALNQQELEIGYEVDPHFSASGLMSIENVIGNNIEVLSCAAGWGHTALVVKSSNDKQNRLFMTGRPHDFQALLRLKRMPDFMRDATVYLSTCFNSDKILSLPGSGYTAEGTDNRSDCILSSFKEVDFSSIDDSPLKVKASSGLSFILGSSGTLYSLGLNHHGQAGVGEISNNVWDVTPVKGLDEGSSIIEFDCGLQHGVAVDENNVCYSWGKGSRGQLGHGDNDSLQMALPISFFQQMKVLKASAGYNHSSCFTDENEAYTWGKIITFDDEGKVADSFSPIRMKGLPKNLEIVDISCGSHHTSVLMEDGSVYAIGIATDNNAPILEEAVQIIPPNEEFTNPKQFESHFDRTTIIPCNGENALEVQLWSDEELRSDAAFIPTSIQFWRAWKDSSGSQDQKIKFLSRGWQHSVLVTE